MLRSEVSLGVALLQTAACGGIVAASEQRPQQAADAGIAASAAPRELPASCAEKKPCHAFECGDDFMCDADVTYCSLRPGHLAVCVQLPTRCDIFGSPPGEKFDRCPCFGFEYCSRGGCGRCTSEDVEGQPAFTVRY